MDKSRSSGLRQFVTFLIEDDLYGFDIRIVKEVYPQTDITGVPLSHEKFRGLINIRGQIVLVIDIAVLFGRAPRPVTSESQLVIIKTRQELELMHTMEDKPSEGTWSEKPVAFLVDGIGDVLTVDRTVIDRVPPHIPENIAAYLEGVSRIDNELLILLSAQQLL